MPTPLVTDVLIQTIPNHWRDIRLFRMKLTENMGAVFMRKDNTEKEIQLQVGCSQVPSITPGSTRCR